MLFKKKKKKRREREREKINEKSIVESNGESDR